MSETEAEEIPWGMVRAIADPEVARWLATREAKARAEGAREFRDHCLTQAVGPVAPGCPAAAEYAFWMRVVAEVDAAAAARGVEGAS